MNEQPDSLPEGRFAALLGRFHYIVNAVTLTLVTVVIGADVTLRYVLNSPLPWSIEATGMLLILMVFGSIPYVWERNHHIRMELIYVRLGPRGKAAADLVTAFAGCSFSVLLCYQMALNVPEMIQVNERAEYLTLPYWPFAAFISLVAAAMTLQFAGLAARSLMSLGSAVWTSR